MKKIFFLIILIILSMYFITTVINKIIIKSIDPVMDSLADYAIENITKVRIDN